QRPGDLHDALDLRHLDCPHGNLLAEIDDRDLVTIIRFVERERERRARIADRLASDALRAMHVAERDVIDVLREHPQRCGFLPADRYAALAEQRWLRARDVQV